MIDYLGMVREFHTKYNHYTSEVPHVPPGNVIELRDKLISEECEEFSTVSRRLIDSDESLTPQEEITELADALGDILYVVFGAALAYGIPIDKVFAEIHSSNMTKSMLKDEKSIKGKTIKGPDYVPPNIAQFIDIPSFGEE